MSSRIGIVTARYFGLIHVNRVIAFSRFEGKIEFKAGVCVVVGVYFRAFLQVIGCHFELVFKRLHKRFDFVLVGFHQYCGKIVYSVAVSVRFFCIFMLSHTIIIVNIFRFNRQKLKEYTQFIHKLFVYIIQILRRVFAV